MTALHTLTGSFAGSGGFRMMPTDQFDVLPGTATARATANGVGWLLTYTWGHPSDGEHAGTLLVGTPGEGGTVTAGWMDSFHQKPDVRLMTGVPIDRGIRVESDYDGWIWVLEVLTTASGGIRMLMHNTVPAGLEGYDPGPYVVMDATWDPVPAA